MQGYFKARNNDVVVFDAFYRENPCGGGYAIACGLEQVIDYIKNLQFSADDIRYLQSLNMFDEDFLKYLSTFRFSGSIYAIPEGTVMFPREPFIKVIAPIMEAQLPVFTVPALLSSAAAAELPTYLQDRFSTFRSKAHTPTAGS